MIGTGAVAEIPLRFYSFHLPRCRCLWLGQQCLAVGCRAVGGTVPSSPSVGSGTHGAAEPEPEPEPEPDIGAGLHQLALASWWLQRSGAAEEAVADQAAGSGQAATLPRQVTSRSEPEQCLRFPYVSIHFICGSYHESMPRGRGRGGRMCWLCCR
jgi:hypothetical protein